MIGLPLLGAKIFVRAHHQSMSFDLGLDRERQVNGHLVTVEVGVEALAHQWMQVNRVTFQRVWFKGLDADAVKSRSSIQKNRVILDDLLKNIPNFFVFAFQHLLGRLDRVGVLKLLQHADDERLVKFKCYLLRQTALMQLQSWTDDDNASAE